MLVEFDFASSTAAFIDAVASNLTDNIGKVLIFAASILAWVVLKKWIFGGTTRI